MSDALARLNDFFTKHAHYRTRGFLPAEDPLAAFPPGSGLEMLDKIGADLPEMLRSPGFREHMRETFHPGLWFGYCGAPEDAREMRLYYARLAFIASGYIHQIGQLPATLLPRGIAGPLAEITRLLGRPPILSYDGYALYNWRRLDPQGPITPDNLATIQNFMFVPDTHGVNQERWFIVIHVAIEAAAARIHDMLARYAAAEADLSCVLWRMAEAVCEMDKVQARIPEHMDPMVYHQTFRRYIQGFDGVTYENVSKGPLTLRGETGAQSSIFPLLDSFLKVRHDGRRSATRMFADMRNYMPAEHRELLALVDALPLSFAKQSRAVQLARNEVLDAMYAFNARHLGNADRYIYQRTGATTGTGGTPRGWLAQMAADRLASKL